jgi:hypothetical protein
MVSDELKFCTNCGAHNKPDNEFCIGCGEKLNSGSASQAKESPVELESATMTGVSSKGTEKAVGFASRKTVVILLAAVLLSFVAGAGLTSENVFSGIIGNRYTEKRLSNEKKQSYEIGYNSGEAAGYDVGYQRGNGDGYARGYSTGVSDGCNSVFDRVGADQLIAIFYPYRTFNVGRYYSTRSDTC